MAAELAADIRRLWAEWSVSPDVTGQYTRPVLERLLLRTWLRDGEVFAQMVSGAGNGLERTAGVPFWLEAMEPDFVPMRTDESAGLNQGFFLMSGEDRKNIWFIKIIRSAVGRVIRKKSLPEK